MANQLSPEQLFNQNFQAIQAAKAQTGDWEKAYQQVTGTPWPKGQHITVGDDGGHMEKDQSKWKKAANIGLTVAPFALAPFTGGASMAALMGGGLGVAKSALNGGGWSGALKGGLMGAASGYGANKIAGSLGNKLHIPGMGGGNPATPPLVGNSGGNTIADLMKHANVPIGKLITNVNATNGVNPGGGFMSGLLNAGKKIIGAGGKGNTDENGGDQKWADASSTLDSLGMGELARRAIKGEMTQGYDKLNLDAAEQNRQQESDAMKKLAQTSYIQAGGAKPLPTHVNSGALTNFGFGPTPSSDAQKQGASTLQSTLLKRLTPEGALKPTDPGYLNEGNLEKVGKYGSAITGGIGAAKTIFGW